MLKRKILFFVLNSILIFSMFSFDRAFSGEKDVRVLVTQWFDIIYSPKSEKTARILYEKADGVYQEISDMYGMPIPCRMPVVIVSGVEQFNAYYTSYPYNHIVLYDTAVINELAVFSETTLSTFRHELTHAFTYNMKNKFWTVVDKIFGDPIIPGSGLFVTSGLAEGATVSSESYNGEGRLNDEFSWQMVRQAKIENKFPSFFDVQGAADIYPANSFYYFNGAFNAYLQQKYGMEKYAKLWYKCVNFQTISFRSAFKKIYGIKVQQAWEDFKESVYIPELETNDSETNQVQTFFDGNKESSLYTGLVNTEKGIYYLDDKLGNIYFISKENLFKDKKNPKKIYSNSFLSTFTASSDGRFLAINEYNINSAFPTSRCGIYDTEHHKKILLKQNSLTNPAVISDGQDYYLICQSYADQQYTINVSKLILDKNAHLKSLEPYSQIDEKLYDVPSGFTDLGQGQFAYVLNSKLNFSLIIRDVHNLKESAQIVKLPFENMVIRYLSYDFNTQELVFTYTVPKSMPRLGKLNINTKEFSLQTSNISGGVYTPVQLDSGDIIFTGKFYKYNKILNGEQTLKMQTFAMESPNLLPDTVLPNDESLTPMVNLDPTPNFEKELPYRQVFPFEYYKKGIFIPFFNPIISPTRINGESLDYSLPFSFTYITANPWSEVGDSYLVAVGYGLETNSFALQLSTSGGTSSSLFNYNLDLTSEFDFKGWKQEYFKADFWTQFLIGQNNVLVLEFIDNTIFGRLNNMINIKTDFTSLDDSYIGYASPLSKDKYLYTINAMAFTYSNVHKTAPGRYNKFGFLTQLIGYYTFNSKITGGYENYIDMFDMEFALKAYIPQLLPIINTNGFTYNLPMTLKFSLFPSNLETVMNEDTIFASNSYFCKKIPSYDIFAAVRAEIVLFATEIQKSICILPFAYVNEFRVSTTYVGCFVDMQNTYQDLRFTHVADYKNMILDKQSRYFSQVGLKMTLGLTPNFGISANSGFKTDLFALFDAVFDDRVIKNMGFTIGIQTNY